MSSNIIDRTLLDQFHVEAFIASGGMGAVYRVRDLQRNVPLAMKVLHSELAEDPAVFKRFKREANALKRLSHPNIVQFYGLYQSEGMAFIVQSFVDGTSLQSLLRQRGGNPLSLTEAFTYFKAVGAALGYAHVNGVVHCDVKPGNVLVDRGGNIFITDFGVARHAESAVTTFGPAGTPAYMAPEQILGRDLTAAADVYALGVMMFELLTGKRPFRGATGGTAEAGANAAEAIRQAHLSAPRPDATSLNPAVPRALADVVAKAMAIDPRERFASTRDFFAAACLAAGLVPERVADRLTDTTIFTRREYDTGKVIVSGAPAVSGSLASRAPWIAAAAILFLLICIAGGLALSRNLPLTFGSTPTFTPTRLRPTPTLQPTYTPRPTYTPQPTQKPASTAAPVRVIPTFTTTSRPMVYMRRTSYCRSGPGSSFGDVTFVNEGLRFPIIGWNPDGWWKVQVDVNGKTVQCWVGNAVVVVEGNISNVPVLSR